MSRPKSLADARACPAKAALLRATRRARTLARHRSALWSILWRHRRQDRARSRAPKVAEARNALLRRLHGAHRSADQAHHQARHKAEGADRAPVATGTARRDE